MRWILVMVLAVFAACEKGGSKPNYVYKEGTPNGPVAKVLGKEVTEAELYRGIEGDLYEAEMRVYDLKMGKLRAYILERLMENHPDKKGLTNDEFLAKHISTSQSVSDSDIENFIKEKNIPSEHVNDQLKERVKSYLAEENKRKAVEVWIDEQIKTNPVEVYLPKPRRPTFEADAADAPFVGDKDAKVTVLEFSDFQCPFCAKGAALLEEIKKKYGDKVKVAFRNFPLPFHQNARLAAEAGLCAHEQGNFWKMHDIMFANQEKLSQDDLKAHAEKIGLDGAKFTACLSEHRYKQKVDSDVAAGEKLGIKSTPTFFVNGKLISGAQPIEVFSEVIDEELSK